MPVRWDSSRQATVDDLGHQWDSATQSWGPLQPPAAGSAPASPASGTGGDAATGTQFPLDTATIAHYGAMDRNAIEQTRAQAAANAAQAAYNQQNLAQTGAHNAATLAEQAAARQQQGAYQTGSLAEQAAARQQTGQYQTASLAEQAAARQQTGAYQTASLAEQTASRQQALQIANQQFAAQMAQYAAQYQLDVQRFGLSQAEFNYNQKKDEAANKLLAAQFGMSVANFNLNKEQFNAQQRKDVADAKLKIDTLLASKSGPGDWVQYNNLLNGMTKPTPTGTTVTDPYAALKDMYQPSTAQAPTMPDLSVGGAPSNITPAPFPSAPAPLVGAPAPGGAGTGLTPATPRGGALDPSRDYAGGNPLIEHQAQPAGGGSRPGASNFTPSGSPPHAAPPNSNPSFMPPGAGGEVATPAAPSPGSGFGVTPPAGYSIMPDGTVKHMAQGGTTGGAALVGDAKSGKPTGHEEVAYAATNPQTGVSELHVIPHQRIASLLDKEMGRHNGTVIGAHKMPPSLLAGLPRAAMGGTFGGQSQDSDGGGFSSGGNLLQQQPQISTNFDNGSTPITNGTGDPSGGTTAWANPRPVNSGGSFAPPPMGNPGSPSTSSHTGGAGQPYGNASGQQNVAQGTGLSSSNIAAAGGSTNLLSGPNPATSPSTSTGYVPDAPGSYGTVNTQPYSVLNKYDPQTLGAQPFIQRILGNMPGRQFGNFGASLDNPSLGIKNMPFNISMQRYNLLSPSEQEQLKSLYSQGLGTSFDDVLAAAQASAPTGRNRSSYGQAIQPAGYGR